MQNKIYNFSSEDNFWYLMKNIIELNSKCTFTKTTLIFILLNRCIRKCNTGKCSVRMHFCSEILIRNVMRLCKPQIKIYFAWMNHDFWIWKLISLSALLIWESSLSSPQINTFSSNKLHLFINMEIWLMIVKSFGEILRSVDILTINGCSQPFHLEFLMKIWHLRRLMFNF